MDPRIAAIVRPGRYTRDPKTGITRERLGSDVSELGDMPVFPQHRHHHPFTRPFRSTNSSESDHRPTRISTAAVARKISEVVRRKITDPGPDPLLVKAIITKHQGVVNEGAVLYPLDHDLPPKYNAADSTVVFADKLQEDDIEALPTSFDSAEDVLLLLENPGRFQLIQFILMCLMYFTLSFNDLIPMFYNVMPVVTCVDPTYGLKANETASADNCHCAPAGVNYTYHGNQWSIIADMNLICDRAHLIVVPTTLYFLGNLVAGPSSGSLADAFGRRKALMIANIIYTLGSFGCIFSRDIVSFCILRFIVGLGRQGIHSISFVLMLEWMTPWRRGPGCAIAVFAITLGALVLALVTYLIQNWWYIQIVLTLANVWYLGLIWFGPESLKWLLLNNRPGEAREIVRMVAKFNQAIIPEAVYDRLGDIALSLNIHKNDGKPYSVGDWFREHAIRRFIICSCWIWFASFLVYLSYSLLIPAFTSSLYANLAIGAALELLARFIAIIVSCLCGNRAPLMYYFIIGGSLALLAGIIPGADFSERIAKAVILVIGRMIIAMCSSVQFVYVQELFPTIVRNSAFGLCSVAFRIGDILGGYLVMLATVRTCSAHGVSTSGLPLEIMGLVALLGAITTYFLPETRGKKMPETIQGAEHRHEETQALERKHDQEVKKIQ